MLRRIRQLTGIGRFEQLEHPKDDDLKFRRLTLVFARNAAGKTTVVRTLAAAGRGDAEQLLLHKRIGYEKAPEVTLETDAGPVRFNGTAWTGTLPRVVVFDREFIEANVYVGRHQSKRQRKNLLRMALGPDDVGLARQIDDLARQGRKVVNDLKPHAATVSTAARGFDLTEEVFLALQPIANADDQRRELQTRLDEATKADEVRKRPRPVPFPDPPSLELDLVDRLLRKDARRVGDEAQAVVEAHLRERLGGRGEGWVRQGMTLLDGGTCPFCAQDLTGVSLIQHYRDRFDEGYAAFVAALDEQLDAVERIHGWWKEVKRVGAANVAAFSGWADVVGEQLPAFGSADRRREVDEVAGAVSEWLKTKRARPMESLDPPADLDPVRARWSTLREATRTYNTAVTGILGRIDQHLESLARRDSDALRLELKMLDARERRQADDVARAVDEKDRLDKERLRIEAEKKAATERMKEGGEARLQKFASNVNHFLRILCADFLIEQLGAERVGGDAGVGYTLVVEAGKRSISSRSEDPFARILSDGDRSTIALAVFLSSLADEPNLGEVVLVFDDPMTSLDHARQNATAELITKFALKTRQALVLSHHDRFLTLLSHDWRRHGDADRNKDIVELELERGRRRLRSWKHAESEHVTRLRLIEAFVESADDDGADRIHGEIRKLLEGDARHRWHALFETDSTPLEPVVRKLKQDAAARRDCGLSEAEVDELDRLCAFGSRANHPQEHRSLDTPDPIEIRGMARRALAWVRR